MALSDLIARCAILALGALFLHDAVWWDKTWFFARWIPYWKKQTQLAQTLYRIFLVMFGSLAIVAGLFGTVVHR
jgi:hypothetical protein